MKKTIEKIKEQIIRRFSRFPANKKILIYHQLYRNRCPIMDFLFFSINRWKCKNNTKLEHCFVDYEDIKKVYAENEVLELLQNYDIISFDIFDTLLLRKVEKPTDVFLKMEQKLGIKDFASMRVEAEYEARYKKYKQDATYEVDFSEIYKELQHFSEDEILKIKNLEWELELELLIPNPVMLNIAKKINQTSTPIIVISDMYFNSSELKIILNRCGYSFIQDIYVSSEYKKSKSNGMLFHEVLRNSEYRNKNLAHIGDNFRSDIMMCANTNIKPIHYIMA